MPPGKKAAIILVVVGILVIGLAFYCLRHQVYKHGGFRLLRFLGLAGRFAWDTRVGTPSTEHLTQEPEDQESHTLATNTHWGQARM